MKRASRRRKKATRKTLEERRILQELRDWTNGLSPNKTSIPELKLHLDEEDFSDEDVATRLLTLGSRGLQPPRQARRTRRILFFFRAPAKWRNLSTFQILWRRLSGRRSVAMMVSFIFHLAIALLLVSIALNVRVGTLGVFVDGGFLSQLEELDFVDESGASPLEEATFELTSDASEMEVELAAQLLTNEQVNVGVSDELLDMDGARLTDADVLKSAPLVNPGSGGVPFHRGRGAAKGRAARKQGEQGRQGDVTKESEDAVERGLAWLARHQLPDGGWAFDLTAEDENGRSSSCRCSNSTSTSTGTAYLRQLHPSRMAATAIALLPFLGSGYTHTESGPYQKTVASGLRYLQYHAILKEDGVDFRDGFTGDGAAYVQALAVLTCCEAYEMTNDENLKSLSEGGIRFIERSQLNDGGWRYFSIGDPMFHSTVDGDTSVLGWQMMALHSGVSAGFDLPVSVTYRAGNFLDLVMDDNGRSYRYQPNSREDVSKRWGTTAVGVLVREYLGWEPGKDPQKKNDLDRGAEQLYKWITLADNQWQQAKKSVQSSRVRNRTITYVRDGRLVYNLYFAYYAALALQSYGGKYWKESFAMFRELLVDTQARSSMISLSGQCEDGSWLFYDQYMNDGGRLLNTALAVLILETPYRYLPMYR